jgi:hypothetical protein
VRSLRIAPRKRRVRGNENQIAVFFAREQVAEALALQRRLLFHQLKANRHRHRCRPVRRAANQRNGDNCGNAGSESGVMRHKKKTITHNVISESA